MRFSASVFFVPFFTGAKAVDFDLLTDEPITALQMSDREGHDALTR
jgi:hypothetical protein